MVSFFKFFACLWTLTPSQPIHTQKKELGQYPAILTSHLVIFSLHMHFLNTFVQSLTAALSGLGNPEAFEFPFPPLLSLLLALLLRLVLTESDDLPLPSSSCKFCSNIHKHLLYCMSLISMEYQI